MADTPGFERRTYGVGSKIFKEGDPGTEAYLIETGTVEVYKLTDRGKSYVLGSLGKGELFGEMALIDGSPRMATAVARSDLEVAVIPREIFEQRLERMDRIMSRVLHILVSRSRSMADQFLEEQSLKQHRERWKL